MNKNSNTYQILYSSILVLVVGAALAFVYMQLRPKQQENIANDKRQQILSAVHIAAQEGKVKETYENFIVKDFIVDAQGNVSDSSKNAAFNVDMKSNVKKPAIQRQLPVFKCQLQDGSTKYILPVYGAGLWGAIWGYVAVDDNGDQVYGAYFSHESETPGLGAEIAKPAFQQQFDESQNKHLYKNGKFASIDVVKKGRASTDGADYVNGISGGTITSTGVKNMLKDCLACYDAFFKNLQNGKSY